VFSVVALIDRLAVSLLSYEDRPTLSRNHIGVYGENRSGAAGAGPQKVAIATRRGWTDSQRKRQKESVLAGETG